MVVYKKQYEEICQLFLDNEVEILSHVLANMKSASDGKLTNEVQGIIQHFFDLIIMYIQTEDTTNLESFAYEVAEFKLNREIEIDQTMDFVNDSRNIFLEWVIKTEMDHLLKIKALSLINDFYSLFTKHTCVHYTSLKNREIEKQSRFIDSMHNDRLTILGKISTSFAHEFRNPLTSIKGFVQLLEHRFSEVKETKKYFQTINHEIDSLQAHVNQFLLLSQKQNHEDFYRTHISINNLINEVLDFLYPSITDKNIQVRVDSKDELYFIGMKSQIKQVIINIINNAIDALENRENERKVRIHVTSEQENIFVSVENNGPMIPKHLVDNIFEPFITTKELGTGLGLSVCKQIIEKHNGTLSCVSEIEKTVFILMLKRQSNTP
ncbi:ATP-binding protein [Anaerobacillus sp. MEB173]|uniref:ATP-binding protein n=1 Tax=Anaerobacillus sp. MEB173 TaxID=3383345 RepID=UPI003F8ED6EA